MCVRVCVCMCIGIVIVHIVVVRQLNGNVKAAYAWSGITLLLCDLQLVLYIDQICHSYQAGSLIIKQSSNHQYIVPNIKPMYCVIKL